MPRKNGLTAYHSDPAVKLKYVSRMSAHQEADELVRGTYWNDGKGCAIGCTVHSADHDKYETELGMPEWLARLEDGIFEGMSVAASRQFPLDLLSAIPVGFAKWDNLYHGFCAYVLRDICKFDKTKHPDVAAAVDAIIRLHEKWTEVSDLEWMEATQSAWSAESSVTKSAPLSSARSVVESAALSAARSAERSAARSAEAATKAARAAVRAAVRSAAESVVWTTAEEAATESAYDRIGDWLVRRFNWEETS